MTRNEYNQFTNELRLAICNDRLESRERIIALYCKLLLLKKSYYEGKVD